VPGHHQNVLRKKKKQKETKMDQLRNGDTQLLRPLKKFHNAPRIYAYVPSNTLTKEIEMLLARSIDPRISQTHRGEWTWGCHDTLQGGKVPHEGGTVLVSIDSMGISPENYIHNPRTIQHTGAPQG
jgi:hypothetical protein